jgi:hypothetical protein
MSSLWSQIKSFFTPQVVNSKPSAANSPTYAAKKAISAVSKNNTATKTATFQAKQKQSGGTTTGANNLVRTTVPKADNQWEPDYTMSGYKTAVMAGTTPTAKNQVPQPTETVQAPQAPPDMSQYFNNGQAFSYNGQTYDPTASGFDLNSILNLSDSEIQQLQDLANQQAKTQNDAQRSALDTLLSQANNTYNSNLTKINNDKTDAQQTLENQSFQDYLKSRQSIADRGLASSGLADDANTRLMLNRNQALASLMKQADAQTSDAKNNFDTTANDIGSKKSALNDASTAATIFQQLKQAATDSKQKNAQMMMDWNKWITPSGDTTMKTQSDQVIANLNNQTKYQIANLNNSTQLQVADMNNNTKLNIAAQDIQQKMAALNSSMWTAQQKTLASQAQSSYSTAAKILSMIPNAPDEKHANDLLSQYNQALSDGNKAWQQAVNSSSAPSYTTSGFNSGSGGGGIQQVLSPSSAYSKSQSVYKSNPTAYNNASGWISTALQKTGADSSWLAPMMEIAAKESTYNPTAQNGHSTAYGLFQFLNGTWGGTGVSKTSDPVQQSVAAVNYIKQRYGTAQNALAFWQRNGWYILPFIITGSILAKLFS